MEMQDTGIKYVDMFNRVKEELCGEPNSLKMNWTFIVTNAKIICEMFEAVLNEVIKSRVHVLCASYMMFARAFKNIKDAKYESFSEFIDAAIGRCSQDETIPIPKDDTKKVEMISGFLERMK